MATEKNKGPHTKLLKGLNIQTIYERIILEQQNILFVKNYTERMIGSTTKNGYFIEQLRGAFGQAIGEHLWDPHIERFHLSMTGRFGSPKDKGPHDSVTFEFTYAYDNVRRGLGIVHLTATLNDTYRAEYPIVNHPSKDLPSAGRVHQDLDRMRTLALANTVAEHEKKTRSTGKRKR